jgi:hypothetical protein
MGGDIVRPRRSVRLCGALHGQHSGHDCQDNALDSVHDIVIS